MGSAARVSAVRLRSVAEGVVLTVSITLAACGRDKTDAPGEASGPAGAVSTGRSADSPPWDGALGSLIATPNTDGSSSVLWSRDTALSIAVDVELFSHDSQTLRGSLRAGSPVRSCARERTATLAAGAGEASAPVVWSLALAPGIATPIAIDGVGELLPRDSAALVARISRLVSALPEDSLSAPFHGLPIVVRDAWRFQLPDGTPVAVAIASRTLNVESNPRADVVTILAEPDSSLGGGAWRTAFARRESGPEDRVEGADLLAAFLVGGMQPAVAFLRESERGLQVDVVERASPRLWRVRWSSVALGCTPS